MLLDNATLQGIVAGQIRVVFRTWRKPTVKAGGTLRTRMGVLAIDAVDAITPRDITARDMKLAGFASRAELDASLAGRDGVLYRIRVQRGGDDPRIALRQQLPNAEEFAELAKRMQRMDAAAGAAGAWTRQYLELIEARPAQRAPELATLMGLETKPFKQRVRRLKERGLTESLRVGYRLSPRGEAYLRHLASSAATTSVRAQKSRAAKPSARKPAAQPARTAAKR